MSITFSYLDGAKSVDEFAAHRGAHRPMPGCCTQRLGDLYVEKQRYQDAATTYRAFVSRDPVDEHAPTLTNAAIEAYRKGGFADLMLEGKLEYVQRYGFRRAVLAGPRTRRLSAGGRGAQDQPEGCGAVLSRQRAEEQQSTKTTLRRRTGIAPT